MDGGCQGGGGRERKRKVYARPLSPLDLPKHTMCLKVCVCVCVCMCVCVCV